MIKVELNKKVETNLNQDFFQKIIESALKDFEINKAEVSIALVDDDEIRKLNKQYRNKDEATDVLSFAEIDSGVEDLDENGYLGEIILSVPYIEKQAVEQNQTFEEEVTLMIRHGLMHLLGYTHDDMKKMKNIKAI